MPLEAVRVRFDRLVGSLHGEGGRLTAGCGARAFPQTTAYVTALTVCHLRAPGSAA